MLAANESEDVRVFVIWEPVLNTDWGSPSATLPSQIEDARARHYWDPERRLSTMLGGVTKLDALAHERQVGFRMKDVLWDLALLYRPGARWSDPAELLLAPVVKFKSELATAMRR